MTRSSVSTHNLAILAKLDELCELSQGPDGVHSHSHALVAQERPEQLQQLGDLASDASSGRNGAEDDGVEEDVEGLEGNLTVGSCGRCSEGPQPWEELWPGALGELDAGERRNESCGSRTSLVADTDALVNQCAC